MATEEDLFNFPWGEDRNECRANIWGSDPFEETSPVGFFDGQLKTRAQGGWLFGPDSFQTCDDSSPLRAKRHDAQRFGVGARLSFELQRLAGVIGQPGMVATFGQRLSFEGKQLGVYRNAPRTKSFALAFQSHPKHALLHRLRFPMRPSKLRSNSRLLATSQWQKPPPKGTFYVTFPPFQEK